MIILDTNVISELMNRRPEESVVAWANAQKRSQLVTTALNVMELHAGVETLKPGRRTSELGGLIAWVLDHFLDGRILSFDRKAAVATAAFHAECRAEGRSAETRNAQIAGIAIVRRIPIATRDVSHFEGCNIKIINPWSG